MHGIGFHIEFITDVIISKWPPKKRWRPKEFSGKNNGSINVPENQYELKMRRKLYCPHKTFGHATIDRAERGNQRSITGQLTYRGQHVLDEGTKHHGKNQAMDQ